MLDSKSKQNYQIIFYNSYLLIKYNAYINIEIYINIKICKYIFKYIYKDSN